MAIKVEKKGTFITLEGIEGAGKSTHVQFIRTFLESSGVTCLVTREPGGTVTGESIREILLQRKELQISAMTELLLMFAARAQHVNEVILPALSRGETVICDRFTDSSHAYQGGGRQVEQGIIRKLADMVHPGLKPDLTLLFDISPTTGLQRAGNVGETDRFESETISFFNNVRDAYLEIASAEPDRFRIIDAEAPLENVEKVIRETLVEFKLC